MTTPPILDRPEPSREPEHFKNKNGDEPEIDRTVAVRSAEFRSRGNQGRAALQLGL